MLAVPGLEGSDPPYSIPDYVGYYRAAREFVARKRYSGRILRQRRFVREFCHEAMMGGMKDNLETLHDTAAIEALRQIKEARGTKTDFFSICQMSLATRVEDGMHLTLTVTARHLFYFGARWTFKPAAVHGYLLSECKTSTAASGEFLHLFWTGAYWVLCSEGPRQAMRQALFRTHHENIFLQRASWQLNELASRRAVDFSSQKWIQGICTTGSLALSSSESDSREDDLIRELL